MVTTTTAAATRISATDTGRQPRERLAAGHEMEQDEDDEYEDQYQRRQQRRQFNLSMATSSDELGLLMLANQAAAGKGNSERCDGEGGEQSWAPPSINQNRPTVYYSQGRSLLNPTGNKFAMNSWRRRQQQQQPRRLTPVSANFTEHQNREANMGSRVVMRQKQLVAAVAPLANGLLRNRCDVSSGDDDDKTASLLINGSSQRLDSLGNDLRYLDDGAVSYNEDDAADAGSSEDDESNIDRSSSASPLTNSDPQLGDFAPCPRRHPKADDKSRLENDSTREGVGKRLDARRCELRVDASRNGANLSSLSCLESGANRIESRRLSSQHEKITRHVGSSSLAERPTQNGQPHSSDLSLAWTCRKCELAVSDFCPQRSEAAASAERNDEIDMQTAHLAQSPRTAGAPTLTAAQTISTTAARSVANEKILFSASLVRKSPTVYLINSSAALAKQQSLSTTTGTGAEAN